MDTEKIKRSLRKKRQGPKPVPVSQLLSSGSTMLNLACSGRAQGAFPKGSYVLFVGDSDSGKTWITMTCLAEAAVNKRFDDYRFIYDGTEGGAQMDIEYYFGSAVADRLEAPIVEDGMPVYSQYIQDFYFALDDALDQGPCIYILDSMDCLTSKQADEKFETVKVEHRAGKDSTGSYGDGKAKLNSEYLRRVIPKLRSTGSILIIINQTRDNIGFGAQFNPKTRSGGRALRFYADIEIWSSIKQVLKKTVKGKPRNIGILSRCDVKRSRTTGKKASVLVPIYHRFGIDDVGSIVDWLIEEGHWQKPRRGKKIVAPEFQFEGTMDKLISYIEESELERDLRDIAGDAWAEIESLSTVKRKRRYE